MSEHSESWTATIPPGEHDVTFGRDVTGVVYCLVDGVPVGVTENPLTPSSCGLSWFASLLRVVYWVTLIFAPRRPRTDRTPKH